MILLFLVLFSNIISIQSSKTLCILSFSKISFSSSIESYEIPSTHSNEFLKSSIFGRSKYEESRETVEANREVSAFRRYRYSIVIFFRHVLMNIAKGRSLTVDGILYPPSVFNTVTKRRIAKKMMVEFEWNDQCCILIDCLLLF